MSAYDQGRFFEVLKPGDRRQWVVPHFVCLNKACGVAWRNRTIRMQSGGGFVLRRTTCPECHSGRIRFVGSED